MRQRNTPGGAESWRPLRNWQQGLQATSRSNKIKGQMRLTGLFRVPLLGAGTEHWICVWESEICIPPKESPSPHTCDPFPGSAFWASSHTGFIEHSLAPGLGHIAAPGKMRGFGK